MTQRIICRAPKIPNSSKRLQKPPKTIKKTLKFDKLRNNPKNLENDNSLNIKKFIPDLHQIQLKNNQLVLDKDLKNKEIFIKSHYSFDQMKNFPMDKIILVIRNPLDVFVSLYNYYNLDIQNKNRHVEDFAKNHT